MAESVDATIRRALQRDLDRYLNQLIVLGAAVSWTILVISAVARQSAVTDIIVAGSLTIVAVLRGRIGYRTKFTLIFLTVSGYAVYSITQVGFFGLGPVVLTGVVVVSVVFLDGHRTIPVVAFPGVVFLGGAVVIAMGLHRFSGDWAARINNPLIWLNHGFTILTLSFITYSSVRYMRERITRTAIDLIRQTDELRHLAYTDRVTGLPNYDFFEKQITDRIADGVQHGYFIIADISRFGRINSLYGYEYGDNILATLGSILLGIPGHNELVARLQSDQFALWIEDDNPNLLNERIRRLRDWVERSLAERGAFQRLQFHVGVAKYPENGDDFESCNRNAGIAINVAKRRRDFQTVFFQTQMLNDVTLEVTLNRLLRRSIDRNELNVVYQPKVDVHTGKWTGLEALARWKPAEIGEVSPATFIPIATQHRMIASLGERIVDRVFTDLPLINATLGPVVTSINVSPNVFLLADYPQQMIDTAERFGIDPTMVCLEITEDVFVQDVGSVDSTIRTLRSAGFRIAIDDFGKGYSSMYYITALRFDELKIDKWFVDRIDSDQKRFSLLESICSIADTYEMHVVAEGVETEPQAAALRRSTCRTAQGYHYAPPQPLSELVIRSAAP